MALTTSTLTSAITDSTLDIPVASNTGAAAGKAMKIDNEYMAVVELKGTTLVSVRSRGDQGTQAVAHNALSRVVFGTGEAGEWPDHPVAQSGQIPPAYQEHVTIGVDGAVQIPVEDTTFAIAKATAGAITLGAPNKAINGVRLTFTSLTAAAHVITATGLLKTGAVTTNTATFAAQIGAGFTVMAEDGLWNVVASVGVTFA